LSYPISFAICINYPEAKTAYSALAIFFISSFESSTFAFALDFLTNINSASFDAVNPFMLFALHLIFPFLV
jgi:hypothetical protein